MLTLQYQYGESGLYLPCGSGLIKNCTEYSAAAIQKELAKSGEEDYAADLSQPSVLISTPTRRNATNRRPRYYDTSSDWHSTDRTKT